MWRWCDEMSNSVLKTAARNAFFVLHCVLLRNFVGLKRNTVEIPYHINRYSSVAMRIIEPGVRILPTNGARIRIPPRIRKPPTVDMRLRNQSISPTYCIYTFVRLVKPVWGSFLQYAAVESWASWLLLRMPVVALTRMGQLNARLRGDGTAKPYAFGAPVRFDRCFELCPTRRADTGNNAPHQWT